MPELPEVETTARELRPQLLGRQIVRAEVAWSRSVAVPEPSQFIASVVPQQIVVVDRRAKFLVLGLQSGDSLLVHLRMTGRLWVEPAQGAAPVDPYVRAWFDLSDDRRLVFSDMRKFGRLWLLHDTASVFAKLGPEPLDDNFLPEVLAERVRRRRVAIKPLLLDQTVVAGLGNIYADEALFVAGLHPLRRASDLSDIEVGRLWSAIRQVLTQAVGERGTTLRDYRPPNGGLGNYQELRRVYGLQGKPCSICGMPIERLVIAERSAHFCPHCQAIE